jgi:hypothetical protein
MHGAGGVIQGSPTGMPPPWRYPASGASVAALEFVAHALTTLRDERRIISVRGKGY